MSQENTLSSPSPEKDPSEKQQIKDVLRQMDLYASKHQAKKVQLNESFMTRLNVSETKDAAAKEKSMLTLSNEYIQQLEAFKLSNSPSEAKEFLEKSEALWQQHTSVVLQEAPEEASFFKELRVHLFSTLNQKLEHLNRKDFQQNENLALCQQIISLQDKVLEELGHPAHSPERTRLQEIAKGFIR